FSNNISNSFVSTGSYQGIYGPGYNQGNSTMAHYFADITDANQRFHKNVLISGDASKYTNYSTASQNYFPPTSANVGFVNYAGGPVDYHNYALKNTSPYYNTATDNQDIGVNFVKLDSALNATRCDPVISNIQEASAAMQSILIFPNPSNGAFTIQYTMNQMENVSIIITDALGRTLSLKRNINQAAGTYSEISDHDLRNGIYNVAVLIGDKLINTRVIIAH
ncbi:MAG: T9SS type A sorting domain-containing protein, partial [Saprospiraceae bacterium]